MVACGCQRDEPGTYCGSLCGGAGNPLNPDQWVVFGRRGVDEMSHMWVGITNLEQGEYERLMAERRQRIAAQQDGG